MNILYPFGGAMDPISLLYALRSVRASLLDRLPLRSDWCRQTALETPGTLQSLVNMVYVVGGFLWLGSRAQCDRSNNLLI